MKMERPIVIPPVARIPPQYQPVVKSAREIGTRLGDTIADGWDNLVDWLFNPKQK